MLCSRFSWAHVSVGDELRRLVQSKETDDEVIKDCVQKENLIPVDRLAKVLKGRKDWLESVGHNKIFIDGFPRKIDQIEDVHATIGIPDLVICLDCPQESARARVLNRRNEARADTDTEVVFDRRHKEFSANNEDMVRVYSEAGIFESIDTSGKSLESFELLLAVLRKRGFVLAPDSA